MRIGANLLINLLFLFFFFSASGQKIEGYATDANSGAALENILISATSQNDTTKQKSTVTDFSGFYKLYDVLVGINDVNGFAGDKMSIVRNGNKLEINITSKHDIKQVNLFTGDGKAISAGHFDEINKNQFKAIIDVQNIATQMVFFSDGIHSVEKLFLDRIPTQRLQMFISGVTGKPVIRDYYKRKESVDMYAELDFYESSLEVELWEKGKGFQLSLLYDWINYRIEPGYRLAPSLIQYAKDDYTEKYGELFMPLEHYKRIDE